MKLQNLITSDWKNILKEEFDKEYFKKLDIFINNEYLNNICFPPYDKIFNALNLTSYKDTKVVIIGQDPYHNKDEANGLSFSVDITKLPPSLKNIYKELKTDLGISKNEGSLVNWAKNGVLLLNSTLTVRLNEPNCHKDSGWSLFTDEIIKILNNKNTPIVFILWGNFAISKEKYITNPIHKIIKSAHPSPLSAYHGFFGSKPFSKTNEFLINNNIEPIDWS